MAGKEYYHLNKDKIKAKWALDSEEKALKQKQWYAEKGAAYYAARKEADTPRALLASARNRAKEMNLPFTITVEDIVIPEICPYLKCPLTYISGKGQQWTNPSLDRIVPELGYIPGNVQVMSRLANTMKSVATPDQLRQFALSVLEEQRVQLKWPSPALPAINLWNMPKWLKKN